MMIYNDLMFLNHASHMMPCIISNLRAAVTPRSHEVKASTPHVWDAAALIDEPNRSLMTGDGGKHTPSSSQGLMFNQTLTHPEPRGRRATKEISTSHSDTRWQHNAHWRSGSPTDCLHIVCIAKWAEWCHAPCLQRANGFFFFSFSSRSELFLAVCHGLKIQKPCVRQLEFLKKM